MSLEFRYRHQVTQIVSCRPSRPYYSRKIIEKRQESEVWIRESGHDMCYSVNSFKEVFRGLLGGVLWRLARGILGVQI